MLKTDKQIKVISTSSVRLVSITPDNSTEGSIYFTSDDRSLYYDFNNKRTKISDVIVVKTQEDIEQMTNSAIANKFYFIEESQELFFRGGNNNEAMWHNILPLNLSKTYDASDSSNNTMPLPNDSFETAIAKLDKAINYSNSDFGTY